MNVRNGTKRQFARYNERVEYQQARHIGDIIRERENAFPRRGGDLTARAGDTNRRISKGRKMLRLLLDVAVWVPLTIGRLVTLPLISASQRRLISSAHERG
jgi:hypothetical protein